MADMTFANAMLQVGTSTEKTNILSALTTLNTAVTAAATAGKFSTVVRDQLNNELCDWVERVAANML